MSADCLEMYHVLDGSRPSALFPLRGLEASDAETKVLLLIQKLRLTHRINEFIHPCHA